MAEIFQIVAWFVSLVMAALWAKERRNNQLLRDVDGKRPSDPVAQVIFEQGRLDMLEVLGVGDKDMLKELGVSAEDQDDG